MIQDLDKTIQGLLQSKLASQGGVRIDFTTPYDDYSPTLPAINLFLYDVRENRDLRSNEWVAQRPANGTVQRQPPPVRVACAYLITAWAAAIDDEHRLLGLVMQALLSYPTIPLNLLQGDLANDGLPLPTTALQPGSLQSIGEFWQGMRGKPRAALSYTVTISVDVAEPVEAPLVRENIVKLNPSMQPEGTL